MTFRDLLPLLPLMLPALTAVAILLLLAFHRSHRLTAWLAAGGLAAALLLIPFACEGAPRRFGALLVVDGCALFYTGIIMAAALAVAAFSYGYLARRRGHVEEFYVLLLLATTGGAVLTASSHFATFFLGLEVLTVALYTLIAYERGAFGIEAGVKYLVLAAVSTAALLFGVALIYAELGTMEFSKIASLLDAGAPVSLLMPAGVALILVGVGFKLALTPFHLWAPDVYQGAPAPTAAFLSTVSKGAVFAAAMRYLVPLDLPSHRSLWLAVAALAVVSMLAGNLLALRQGNIRRVLAYSSIAHMGYLAAMLLTGSPLATAAAMFYLLAYFVTSLGAWGVIAALSEKEGDAERIEDYRGLAGRHPWLAGALTLMLLSLAGMPLTAGFISKFFLLTAGVEGRLWAPMAALLLGSAIGIFYYVRIIAMLFAPQEDAPPVRATHWAAGAAIGALVLLLIALGVYPAPVLAIIQSLIAASS